MAEKQRDLDDCIAGAKETLADNLEGGANYLRRHGADNSVSELIHECADGAVPVYTYDLLDVFRSSEEIWYDEPDCGFGNGENGITGAISRVVYDAINAALYTFASDLEGDPLVCEEADCEAEDEHTYPADEDNRCTDHCGGPEKCKQCQEEAE